MTTTFRIEWSAFDNADGSPAEAEAQVVGLAEARSIAKEQSAVHGLAMLARVDADGTQWFESYSHGVRS
jgi:hypothetical protein